MTDESIDQDRLDAKQRLISQFFEPKGVHPEILEARANQDLISKQHLFQLLALEEPIAIDWRRSRTHPMAYYTGRVDEGHLDSQIRPRSFSTLYKGAQQGGEFGYRMQWWDELEHYHRVQKREKTGLNDESLDIIEAAMKSAS